jgi:hypothetical protein
MEWAKGDLATASNRSQNHVRIVETTPIRPNNRAHPPSAIEKYK